MGEKKRLRVIVDDWLSEGGYKERLLDRIEALAMRIERIEEYEDRLAAVVNAAFPDAPMAIDPEMLPPAFRDVARKKIAETEAALAREVCRDWDVPSTGGSISLRSIGEAEADEDLPTNRGTDVPGCFGAYGAEPCPTGCPSREPCQKATAEDWPHITSTVTVHGPGTARNVTERQGRYKPNSKLGDLLAHMAELTGRSVLMVVNRELELPIVPHFLFENDRYLFPSARQPLSSL